MNLIPLNLKSCKGLRVTVLGLGSFGGGIAATRFLADRGARVTITDARPASELQSSLDQLKDLDIGAIHTGRHSADDFRNCDLVVVNPAIRPESEVINHARSSGAWLTSEIELFLSHCPADVIAVTGTNGKSTTAALTHHFLTTGANRTSWLGGNIGHSLLPYVERISAEDFVVLELSSFQLELLRGRGFRPSIAIITNFSPNHLDWHGSTENYREAKQILLNHQLRDDLAVVSDTAEINQRCADTTDAETWRVRAQLMRFGTVDSGENGVFAEDGTLVFRDGAFEDAIRLTQPKQLPGQHNLRNIAAAACAAWKSGVTPTNVSKSLAAFQSLPHRIQTVAKGGGIHFINDSVSTTPESSIAALNTMKGPTVIIAGGADKGADLSKFAEEIRRKADAVVLIGQTAATLKHLIEGEGGFPHNKFCVIASDFKDAFDRAVALSSQGGIVLLSPGCASYGWFRDYRERGDVFSAMALQWTNNQ